MKFTKDSGLVKTWVNLAPNLFNLREVIYEILDEQDQAADDAA